MRSSTGAAIKALLGLVRPDFASFLVDGEPAAIDNEWKRRIGYLPEAVAFSENLSGRGVLRFFARARGERGERPGQRGVLAERVIVHVHDARPGLEAALGDQLDERPGVDAGLPEGLLEVLVVHSHDHITEHLNKTTIRVPCKPFLSGAFSNAGNDFIA